MHSHRSGNRLDERNQKQQIRVKHFKLSRQKLTLIRENGEIVEEHIAKRVDNAPSSAHSIVNVNGGARQHNRHQNHEPNKGREGLQGEQTARHEPRWIERQESDLFNDGKMEKIDKLLPISRLCDATNAQM